MTIMVFNGSPRGKESNSAELIRLLQERCPAATDWRVSTTARKLQEDWAGSLAPATDASAPLLLVFPLYTDGLPASMLRQLDALAAGLAAGHHPAGRRVFALANCGFYEGMHNRTALWICRNFCQATGLDWCGGLGIGTGEMIRSLKSVPPQAGIRRPVIAALDTLLEKMLEPSGRLENEVFVQHQIPWTLYKLMGEMGWRRQAKSAHLKRRDLDARPLDAQ